jgi:thiamine biosynthesis lipoprotein
VAPDPVARKPAPVAKFHHREEVMGTVVTIDLFNDADLRRADVEPQLLEAVRLLHDADEVFSTWKPESPVSRLRRGEIEIAQAPAEVAEVLDLCATARDLSGGWFDPWAIPGGVDPTGYVKGWAAQRALDALVSPAIGGAIVNAAGDIATFGGPADGVPFRVGIVDPASPRELAFVVETAGAVATSGVYERGEHLVNPRTGESRTAVASATVSGPDLGLADALATALAVGGDEVLARIEVLEGYEALEIGFDGVSRWTTGFRLAAPTTTG